MTKRILSLTAVLLACLLWASAQTHRYCPMLQYNNGRLTLLCGPGALYDLGGDENARKQNLAHIYYLFTDEPFIYIYCDYTPGGSYGYTNLAILNSDTNDYWYYGVEGFSPMPERTISCRTVQESTLFGLHWNERVEVLFDTKDHQNKSHAYTVELVILPTPPYGTNITRCTIEDKNIQDGLLTGDLIIERTGSIVFDSFQIDGISQHEVTYNSGKKRDTPFYRIDSHAKIALRQPVAPNQRNLTVTAFYRILQPDGSITNRSEDIIVCLRPSFPYAIVGVAAALVAVIILLVRLIAHSKGSRNSNTRKHRTDSYRPRRRNKALEEIFDQHIAAIDADGTVDSRQAEKYRTQLAAIKNQLASLPPSSDAFNRSCIEAVKELSFTCDGLKRDGNTEAATDIGQLMRQLYIMSRKK